MSKITTIVAVKDADKNNIIIGGDSALVGGYDIHPMKNPKVFRNGPYAFGIAGSARVGNLLQFKLKPTIPANGMDLHEFMVNTFIEQVRVALRDAGSLGNYYGGQLFPGVFMVAHKDRFFTVDADFQVSEMIDPFNAIGVGAEIARGSLAATALSNLSAQKRAEIALTTTAKYNGGVCPPFNYITS